MNGPKRPDLSKTPVNRRTLVKGTAAAGIAASAGAGLFGFSPGLVVAQGEPQQGGEYRAARTEDSVSFHPFQNTDTASFEYIDLVNRLPLLRYNQDTIELEPFAAESFEESEDHTKITFNLRQDLVWSDGEPLTANDYVWSWEQALIEENAWPRLGSYQPFITSITNSDDYTIEVELTDPIAISLEKANGALTYVLPKHIWESLDWSDPETNPEIMAPSVSAGPFILDEWKKEQYATFVANESFFLGRPNFDKVTFQFYGNGNVALQALFEGEIDRYGPNNEGWPDVQDNDSVVALQWDSPENGVLYFGFNTRLPMFSDAKVRQALNFALDKELITQELTYGLGQRALGMYLPTSWAYNPDVEPFTYNVDKAKELLDEAGWAEGDDGVRVKDGERLAFQFIFGPNNDPIREQMATVAQQMWGEVGAEVEVAGLEWGAFLQLTKEGPYDWGVFLNMYIASIDPDMIWFKKEAGPAYNRAGWENEQVQQLYADGLLEFDREKRAEIYKEAMNILTEESPWIYVYYEQGYAGFTNRVKGVEITNLGLNDIWEWWLEQ